jgi:hypothetical protein
MYTTHSLRFFSAFPFARLAGILLVSAFALFLSGCGSTKVYTADKSIVYGGDIYNLGNVQRVGSRAEATLPDKSVVNVMGMDKSEINDLLDEHSSFLLTTMIDLDSQQMVYQSTAIDSYSDYSKSMKDFDKALNKITKFMADKKKTQLKL